jgi:hypothetical protein
MICLMTNPSFMSTMAMEGDEYMNGKPQQRFITRLILVLILLYCGCFVFVLQTEAELTAQTINGTVEVLLAGEQTWKPLTTAIQLKTGDQIRTGQGSSVDLWFEDGSVLNLTEGTQLAISQLEVSTTQKSRVARFKLWWGSITAKITKLAFTENVCEVETDVVLAGIKFSEMTVNHPQNTTQYDVIGRQGLLTIQQTAEGTVNVSGLLSEQEGVTFALNSVGAKVLLGIQKIVGKITLESNVPLTKGRILLAGEKRLLRVNNTGTSPVNLGLQGMLAMLKTQGAATFGVPQGQDITFETEQIIAALLFKPRLGIPQCQGLYIFVEEGGVLMNGETLKVGAPNCFPVGEQPRKARGIPKAQGTRALEEKGKEQPVAPVEPASPEGGGRDITPTPTSTPIPTLTPEPTPTDTPEPTPTPTPTIRPKPRPTQASPSETILY